MVSFIGCNIEIGLFYGKVTLLLDRIWLEQFRSFTLQAFKTNQRNIILSFDFGLGSEILKVTR